MSLTFQREAKERLDELPCYNSDDKDAWFAEPGSVRSERAKKACMDCPLYFQCQGYAIDTGIPNGVWGGVDEVTRQRIWANMDGGKPSDFIDGMDAALLPLLQERRDYENFDNQHGDPYDDTDEDSDTEDDAA